jgi:hypothetical protein
MTLLANRSCAAFLSCSCNPNQAMDVCLIRNMQMEWFLIYIVVNGILLAKCIECMGKDTGD